MNDPQSRPWYGEQDENGVDLSLIRENLRLTPSSACFLAIAPAGMPYNCSNMAEDNAILDAWVQRT